MTAAEAAREFKGKAQSLYERLNPSARRALLLALKFTAIGVLWILLSDWVVNLLVKDPVLRTEFQAIKGLLFIAATAAFVGVLAYSDFREMERARNRQLRAVTRRQESLLDTIKALATAVDKRDPYTANHCRHVARLSRSIGKELGLSGRRLDQLEVAGLVHDIGKIAIPSEILAKPTRLSESEMRLVRAHPEMGYEILSGIEWDWPIDRIVLQHHERCDGSGYPNGLVANQIALDAKILAVADVVEAIASDRPYRPAKGMDAAREEIAKNSGTLYDRKVVEACLRVIDRPGFALD
jgi:HD-GYP domain-containing protein (c-di-GMP phosphodiesterase class II)